MPHGSYGPGVVCTCTPFIVATRLPKHIILKIDAKFTVITATNIIM